LVDYKITLRFLISYVHFETGCDDAVVMNDSIQFSIRRHLCVPKR